MSERITELEARVAVLQQAIGEIYAVANHEHATLVDVVPVIIEATKALEGGVNLLADRQRIAELEAERDRETELRRASERHARGMQELLDQKPYPDEYESVVRERDEAVAQVAALLRQVEAGRALYEHVRYDLMPDGGPDMKAWRRQVIAVYDAARAREEK